MENFKVSGSPGKFSSIAVYFLRNEMTPTESLTIKLYSDQPLQNLAGKGEKPLRRKVRQNFQAWNRKASHQQGDRGSPLATTSFTSKNVPECPQSLTCAEDCKFRALEILLNELPLDGG